MGIEASVLAVVARDEGSINASLVLKWRDTAVVYREK